MDAQRAIRSGGEYSCHAVDSRTTWRYERHLHAGCCDLTYVHSGRLVQEVNGSRSTLDSGMLTLVRDGDLHSVWSRGMVMFTLNFRPEVLHQAAEYLGIEEPIHGLLSASSAPVFTAPYRIRPLLLADYQRLLLMQGSPESNLVFRAFIARWLAEVTSEAPRSAAPPRAAGERPRPAWLAATLAYIEENVERPVTVADLPRVSGRTGEHIARTFRAHLGTTPSGAINAARLERAALLLAHTARPILDICYALGYSNASYFYRLFRGRFGLPPRAYRAAHSVLHRVERG